MVTAPAIDHGQRKSGNVVTLNASTIHDVTGCDASFMNPAPSPGPTHSAPPLWVNEGIIIIIIIIKSYYGAPQPVLRSASEHKLRLREA